MPVYRDSSGRPLTDYTRPSVAVDTAVLTVIPEEETLGVVLVRTRGGWRLPGTFLHQGERLADAVLRSLRVKAGVSGLAPTQLHVFDDPSRDDRGWVLSVAHVDAVPWSDLSIDESLARVTAVTEVGFLPYGHNRIIDLAVDSLRERYVASPDPARLLEPPFTLRQLQQLHEAVAGDPLMRDTFRRTMEPLLRPTGDFAVGTVGKPARLFMSARAK